MAKAHGKAAHHGGHRLEQNCSSHGLGAKEDRMKGLGSHFSLQKLSPSDLHGCYVSTSFLTFPLSPKVLL